MKNVTDITRLGPARVLDVPYWKVYACGSVTEKELIDALLLADCKIPHFKGKYDTKQRRAKISKSTISNVTLNTYYSFTITEKDEERLSFVKKLSTLLPDTQFLMCLYQSNYQTAYIYNNGHADPCTPPDLRTTDKKCG